MSSIVTMMNVTQSSYEQLKTFYDKTLNVDKSTYKSTNDEPTPINCVEEMLNSIPTELWSRSDLKVLDPCCGNGNFHLVVMNILRNYRPIKEILENVLHFNDVNIERLDNVRNVFCSEQYSLNITNDDFLTTEYDTHYDAIVANPPYAKLLDNGKRASKNHNLIKDFLEKALRLLKPNGYIVFITPDNWMSFADRNEIIKKITSLQIVHLNIHTAKKYFKKIGSSFTWYIVENTKHYKDIQVNGLYKNVQYQSFVPSRVRRYIPLFFNREVFSILSKTIDDSCTKFKVETSSDLHKYTKKTLISDVQDAVHVHRLIHTTKQTVWAVRPHKYQEGYKVFISTTDRYTVFVDNCGMTQSIAFIRCTSMEEANQKMNVLKHPLYVFLNNICRWGNFNNIRILQNFPVPNDTNDVFGSFGITEEEKKVILTYL